MMAAIEPLAHGALMRMVLAVAEGRLAEAVGSALLEGARHPVVPVVRGARSVAGAVAGVVPVVPRRPLRHEGLAERRSDGAGALQLLVLGRRLQEQAGPMPEHGDVHLPGHGLRVALADVLHHRDPSDGLGVGHRVEALHELEERGLQRDVDDEVEEALVDLLSCMPHYVVLDAVAECGPVPREPLLAHAAVKVPEVRERPGAKLIVRAVDRVV
mmetsp:Transcript_114123/g.303375  ORF Transcript_114123/g.303375 Transcript_114123/m.303375 type:complete len:214 (+) Transcript_114123:86-727(+)